MTLLKSSCALALCLGFTLGAAIVSARADDNPAVTANPKTAEIYKVGNRYVVAVHRPDGSDALAVVEASHVKAAGNGASGPDLADLMKNGKVTYTVTIAPEGSTASQSDKSALTVPKEAAKGKKIKFTRKQKQGLAELRARALAMTHALDTVGKAIAHGATASSLNSASATSSNDGSGQANAAGQPIRSWP